MATYAIGDVQGCYRELRELLEAIGFEPRRDALWFTGDLVNRGPESLAVLRLVYGLRDRCVVVLGNHDLHLLARAWSSHPKRRKKDTLEEILIAPDRDPMLQWLRGLPLLHHDPALDFVMVHAGLPPQWDLAQARACAAEVEAALRGKDCVGYFDHMYGDEPDRWAAGLEGWERLRFITNCLTRMRYCTPQGRLALDPKGPPGSQDDGLLPWYEVPGRCSRDSRILFGHWATLHLASPTPGTHNVWGIDTGCVWGGRLTAVRLEDGALFSIASRTHAGRDH